MFRICSVTRAAQLAGALEGSRLHFPLNWESGDPQTPPRRAFEIGRALSAAMQSGKLEETHRTLIPCTEGDEGGTFLVDRAALEEALDGHGGIGEFSVALPEVQAASVQPTSFIRFLAAVSVRCTHALVGDWQASSLCELNILLQKAHWQVRR